MNWKDPEAFEAGTGELSTVSYARPETVREIVSNARTVDVGDERVSVDPSAEDVPVDAVKHAVLWDAVAADAVDGTALEREAFVRDDTIEVTFGKRFEGRDDARDRHPRVRIVADADTLGIERIELTAYVAA